MSTNRLYVFNEHCYCSIILLYTIILPNVRNIVFIISNLDIMMINVNYFVSSIKYLYIVYHC